MTKQILAKFELSTDVVAYLRNAVENQQIRGADAATSLLTVLKILNSPLNKEELLAIKPQEEPKKK